MKNFSKIALLTVSLFSSYAWEGFSMENTPWEIKESDVSIHFPKNGTLSDVCIETPRLKIFPTKKEDLNYLCELQGNSKVMEKFATGETKTPTLVKNRLDVYLGRVEKGDPFTSFSVFLKETSDFIGQIILGHGDNKGEAELAYLFKNEFWGQHFGKEAIFALLTKYAKKLTKRNTDLDGAPFERISATSRGDNPASQKILESLEFEYLKQEEKYGALRVFFSLNTTKLLKKKSS